jgi:hypothetical protein
MNDFNESHPMLFGALVARPGARPAGLTAAASSGGRVNKMALILLGALLLSLLSVL